ncbi:hypothetical protein AX16_007686 [Volvariella volvacea WC 439]|nr:hypothetical protein AX16_007686 [Volvariella volvacea WC 439]
MIFSSFRRKIPELSIFHNPRSPPSVKALELLRAAASGPFPPNKPTNPPLEFNLEVVESPPTSDQMNTIMSYLPSKYNKSPASAFLSAHPTTSGQEDRTHTPSQVAQLGREKPSAIRWPIVVDWSGGIASVGDVDGVKGILEVLRKRRDGELKEDEEYKPGFWS